MQLIPFDEDYFIILAMLAVRAHLAEERSRLFGAESGHDGEVFAHVALLPLLWSRSELRCDCCLIIAFRLPGKAIQRGLFHAHAFVNLLPIQPHGETRFGLVHMLYCHLQGLPFTNLAASLCARLRHAVNGATLIGRV